MERLSRVPPHNAHRRFTTGNNVDGGFRQKFGRIGNPVFD
jgi:hypothetical protein